MTRRCEHCGGELPILARRHAIYCSGRCRTAACRARPSIPRELTALPRWVRYSAGKVPLQVNGRNASSTSDRTWTTYAQAQASTTGVGLGFVLDGDGIACIDLDHCIDGGHVMPWAAEILASMPPTYVERSPSGTGLHVWGYGAVDVGRKIRRDDGACIEVYGRGRYMTVTGDRWERSPSVLADLDSVIASF